MVVFTCCRGGARVYINIGVGIGSCNGCIGSFQGICKAVGYRGPLRELYRAKSGGGDALGLTPADPHPPNLVRGEHV